MRVRGEAAVKVLKGHADGLDRDDELLALGASGEHLEVLVRARHSMGHRNAPAPLHALVGFDNVRSVELKVSGSLEFSRGPVLDKKCAFSPTALHSILILELLNEAEVFLSNRISMDQESIFRRSVRQRCLFRFVLSEFDDSVLPFPLLPFATFANFNDIHARLC